MTKATKLDAEELLDLAVAASDRDQSDQAIDFLKRAIEAAPGLARAHYLLGAEHAQIGLFERAIEDMRRAVELDPELDAARFQLGLLFLTSRRVDEAQVTWQPLERLGPQYFYVLFKNGLLALARDEFQACLQLLREGIAANHVNAPLNGDMQRIVGQVEGLLAQTGSGSPAAEEPASHLLVNAYTGSTH